MGSITGLVYNNDASWRVVVPLRARVFCRPQKTLAHFRGGGRKCLTSS